jgi:hypothetical protein
MRITFLDLAQRYVSRRCETRVCLGVPRMGKDSAPVPASSTRRDSHRLGVEYSVVLNWLMRFQHPIALHDPDGPWAALVSGSLQYWPHGKCPQCGLNE